MHVDRSELGNSHQCDTCTTDLGALLANFHQLSHLRHAPSSFLRLGSDRRKRKDTAAAILAQEGRQALLLNCSPHER
eukprot:CAMPEP_0182564258 /NCGR_PEP_ID=MMETSP1324-20130603/6236_1 /TAXON_ID=236786 /ORGANISM="Florenciella sp., Strain RCC1587" /LENGTH=76 /DNA_ID=CAMNT_0024777663 /DNA_START=127 /DNA_END=357 /DNA_ORIENTATION=-